MRARGRERWQKRASERGNAIGDTYDGKRGQTRRDGGAVDVGRRDGRRRCSCLSRVRGRSQSSRWENISFSGYLSLFTQSSGTATLRNYIQIKLRAGPATLCPSLLPHPTHTSSDMAQVTEERRGASVESLQLPPRSFLRSVLLIASCTGAMIVTVSPFVSIIPTPDNSPETNSERCKHVHRYRSSLRR